MFYIYRTSRFSLKLTYGDSSNVINYWIPNSCKRNLCLFKLTLWWSKALYSWYVLASFDTKSHSHEGYVFLSLLWSGISLGLDMSGALFRNDIMKFYTGSIRQKQEKNESYIRGNPWNIYHRGVGSII